MHEVLKDFHIFCHLKCLSHFGLIIMTIFLFTMAGCKFHGPVFLISAITWIGVRFGPHQRLYIFQSYCLEMFKRVNINLFSMDIFALCKSVF